MSGKKEYQVREIFRHNGETLLCVIDSPENGSCSKCEVYNRGLCTKFACYNGERCDNTCVHYVKVTEPEEGMLFRASDGKLYELKKLENFECGCYIIGYTNCTVISYEAFGEDILDVFHWYPVDEKEEETMEKKRHLELSIVKVEGDQVTFRIAEQTHFEKDFCQKGKVFKAKNGIPITSLSKTIIGGISPKNGEYKCYICKFILIMEAVSEYNETDGKGYEKKFPEEGDNFYFITSKMTVSLGEFGSSMDGYEFKMRDAGNCFLTREEAKAALERVKKALKGE